jgi:hypothetical protein
MSHEMLIKDIVRVLGIKNINSDNSRGPARQCCFQQGSLEHRL